MKKIFLTLTVFFITASSFSQKLEENYIDEFTKSTIKRTSWEILVQNMKMNAFVRVTTINGRPSIRLKMMSSRFKSVFSIGSGSKLMLMLSNDSIVSIETIESAVSCKGCGARGYAGSGATGIEAYYPITTQDIDVLKNNTIKKFRVYTDDGFLESEIKEKNGDILKQLLPLVE